MYFYIFKQKYYGERDYICLKNENNPSLSHNIILI